MWLLLKLKNIVGQAVVELADFFFSFFVNKSLNIGQTFFCACIDIIIITTVLLENLTH